MDERPQNRQTAGQQQGEQYQQQSSGPQQGSQPRGQRQGGHGGQQAGRTGQPGQGRQGPTGYASQQQPPTGQGAGGVGQSGTGASPQRQPQQQPPTGQQQPPGAQSGQSQPGATMGGQQGMRQSGSPQPGQAMGAGTQGAQQSRPVQQQGPGGQQLQQSPGMGGGQAQQRGQRQPLQPVSLQDVIETDVVTAQPDTPVATIAGKFAEEDVGSVVIVEDDEPVGIVTDRTVALALEEGGDVGEREVSELMARDPETVTGDTNLFDAVQEFGDAEVRRLPVVDEDGGLVGIVSLDDVLIVLAAEFRTAADVIQSQARRH